MNDLEQFINDFIQSNSCAKVQLIMNETDSNKMRLLYPETYIKYEGDIFIFQNKRLPTDDEVVYIFPKFRR